MMSQAYVATQYAGMDTPEMSCWCLAFTSASLTMKTAKEAGTKAYAMTMKSTATKESSEEMTVPWRAVKGSGAVVTAMPPLPPPACRLYSAPFAADVIAAAA